MNMSVKRVGTIATLTILIGGILFFTLYTTPSKNEKLNDKEGTLRSSFFVSGSNDAPIPYQSIDFTETTSESTLSTEQISLSEFLEKNTQVYTEKLTAELQKEPESKLTVATLKKYGNAVGSIMKKHGDTPENEVRILEHLVTEPSSNDAQVNMGTLANAYLSISDELLTIEAPEVMQGLNDAFSVAHKSVGDGMKTLMESAFTIEDFLSYNDSIAPFTDAYLGIAKMLRIYGVQFDESEPGFLFTLPF